MKKALSLLLSLACMMTLLAGCGGTTDPKTSTPATSPTAGTSAAPEGSNTPAGGVDAKTVNVGMIASNFGTQSFNDDVKAGMDKAIAELGIQGTAIEVGEVSEAANSLRTLIAQGCNFMVVPSSEYRDAMVEVAEEYPEIKFVYLAAPEEGSENILSTNYKENEASFLAGALAAMMSQSNKIGTVLAVAEPLQKRYEAGYRAGAKTINPDCEVQVAFTNSYADVNAGHDMAEAMYKKGVDYVSCFAGACNLGVFNAAKEGGDGKFAMGAATGQFDKMPDKIIASVVKPVDVALFNLLKDYIDTGAFAGGTAITWGLAEGGVALRFTTMNDELLATIPTEVMDKITELTEKISSGEIVVPGTEEEFNSFNYSSPLA